MEDLARFVSYVHRRRPRLTGNRTWLLSFDSLGTKHPSVFIALRRYLALEAKHKKGIDVGELPKTQQAKVPVGCPMHEIECPVNVFQSPVQPNYCDCGVYLIQTAEIFLGRADDFFRQLVVSS